MLLICKPPTKRVSHLQWLTTTVPPLPGNDGQLHQPGAANGIINSQDISNPELIFVWEPHLYWERVGCGGRLCKNNYGSEVSKTDFETTEAVNEVNNWMMETTNKQN
jgi:hypothetical protein